MKKTFFISLLLFIIFNYNVIAGINSNFISTDWPNWRGINWDGKSFETNWSPLSLKKESIIWTVEIGTGYSSMAVKGNFLYTTGRKKEKEIVYCINKNNGKIIWSKTLPLLNENDVFSEPLSTPTLESDRLYTFSPCGFVFCMNSKNGNMIWKKNIVTDLKIQIPRWCFSGSVRIHNDLVILNAGGGVALDKKTGKVIWANKNGECGYTTPVIFKKDTKDYVVIAAINEVIIAEVNTGNIVWTYKWTGVLHDYQADPIIIDNKIFISTAYQQGATLVDFSNFSSKIIWENKKLISNLASYVYFDGLIYGNSNPSYNAGDLDSEYFCLDVIKGKKLWSYPEKLGTLIAVDKYLIRLDHTGNVTIGLRSPDGFKEISKCKVLNDICITPPVFSNGCLYCRNLRGTIICIDLKKK